MEVKGQKTYDKAIITKLENGYLLEMPGEIYVFETLSGLLEKLQTKLIGG
jgi:hypothetical protein